MAMTDDQRYAAITARDARFDGLFFTCVRTTGIFCRPSCPARTPGRRSVEFVASAAAAVQRGYRACKRCGPLAPPGGPDDDPADHLAREALRLIDAGALDGGPDGPAHVADLAARLHVSERTLHRSLVSHTGAGAIAHARMARARRAHALLRSTALPLTVVADAAGFGSERQMYDAVSRIYGVAPSVVRLRSGGIAPVNAGERSRGAIAPVAARGPAGHTGDTGTGGTVPGQLAVRRPFDGVGLAAWMAARAVPGVEEVAGSRWIRALEFPRGPGVLEVDLGVDAGPLPFRAHLADLRDYSAAVAMARRLLDLDADPVGIDAGLARAVPELAPLVRRRRGVRIPGTLTLEEALLWAIAGQQVTTVQTRAQISRATDLSSRPLPDALCVAGVRRLPAQPVRAAEDAGAWFKGPHARREALRTCVPAAPDATLPVTRLREELLSLPGVGPWTADYALLRGARAIDVAPARDAALLAAARDLHLATGHAELGAILARAAPWRSYATMHLWHHAAQLTPTPRRRTPDDR